MKQEENNEETMSGLGPSCLETNKHREGKGDDKRERVRKLEN